MYIIKQSLLYIVTLSFITSLMKHDLLDIERVDDVIEVLDYLGLLCEEREIQVEILILSGAGMLILVYNVLRS